ncbi:MAG: protein-disulfide reductase DsbD family protein [Balneolaceae bacterium]
MNFKKLLSIKLLLTVLMVIGLSTGSNAMQVAGPAGSAGKVDVDIYHEFESVPAGEFFKVAVILDIEDGWKINANQPTEDFLIGTELNLEQREGFVIADMRYQKGKMLDVDFADNPINIYEKKVPIFVEFRSSGNLEPGEYTINGTLRVQACDDHVCLAPSNIDISIPVNVVESGTEVAAINSDIFKDFDSAVVAGSAADRNEIAQLFDESGLIWAFVGIFFIGLALNLTPCVYPMLSVTVSLFGGQASENSTLGKSFSMASIYVFGIVFMYSVLGVVAAYTGSLFGSWLQSPWVLAGIGLLLFLLALSMFGLYELQLPPWLTQKLGSAQNSTGGVIGHFISGLAVGIFAAPCIGPPIIALLAFVGQQGDPFFGFFTFFILAFGLGFPYLILGTFSGLLTKMPKSGMWMVWVKKVFGIVLIGAALFYAGLAFFPAYVFHVIPATIILGGIYLGFIEGTSNDNKLFRRVKWATGVAALIGGFMLVQNLQLESIEWKEYSEDEVEMALAENRPVMLDFYADWCIPCLELDRLTFTDTEVISKTENFMKLKVDLTNYDSPESEELRKRYDVAGVPTIIFLDPAGNEVPDTRVVGFLNANEFLKRVERVPAESPVVSAEE